MEVVPAKPYFFGDIGFWAERTDVHKAAAQGQVPELQRLIQSGASVNMVAVDSITPLHEACIQGQAQCVRLLLDAGAQVDARNVDGSTPLCDACAAGSLECVKLLLEHGATINPALTSRTTSPLHEACMGGGASFQLLSMSDETENVKSFAFLVSNMMPTRVYMRGLGLGLGLGLGYTCMCVFRGENATCAVCHYSPLPSLFIIIIIIHCSLIIGHALCSKVVMGEYSLRGNGMYGQGELALRSADSRPPVRVTSGNPDCVQLLITGGAHLEAYELYSGTPLHVACANEQVECAKALLKAGAKVNAARLHETALHHAARVKNVDLVEMLVEFGGNLYARDNLDKKPIDYTKPGCPTAACLQFYESTPLSLQQLSRVSLRTALGTRALEAVSKLSVPSRIIKYLSYC
uniref:Ankyrin repeat and SOCS box protein 13-like n=1 Tax=Paramormyrops kingsleyae TaxID=1676925 RepID=A0A3B3RT44_9TELE|nr:ankyrin repeat and SOCS box protein 13-like isoform X1 [Paramormyrops kingsleyae]